MSRTVLITGATKGLGQAMSERLFNDGYQVVVSGTTVGEATAVAKKIDPSGERVMGLELNVREKDGFESGLEKLIQRFGKCDVLINNAAMTPTTSVMDISADEFDEVITTNLRGTFFGCQVFGQYFSDQNYGRIVNLTSLAGQMGGTASGAHYAASKGGIITLTKVFARALADHGVTVNAVAPGPIDMPSTREKVPAEKLEQIIQTMIPVKRMSSSGFVADMVAMLASDDAGCTTGACWDTNGGIYMR
ncbi:MAG: 3-oxoacyl-[acyl-carrier protein] reductase [Arenicella sp.]|jgi:3-oxoacyl-[acyl-carrier protein] reductase